MKTSLIVAAISLWVGAPAAFSQTNLPVPTLASQIRTSIIAPAAGNLSLGLTDPAPKIPFSDFNIGPLPFGPRDQPVSRPGAGAVVSSGFSAPIDTRELALFSRLDEDRAIRQSIADEGPLAHAMRRTFEPEVIHFRHCDVACSLITAIKRKNPFCLLNPQFLQINW